MKKIVLHYSVIPHHTLTYVSQDYLHSSAQTFSPFPCDYYYIALLALRNKKMQVVSLHRLHALANKIQHQAMHHKDSIIQFYALYVQHYSVSTVGISMKNIVNGNKGDNDFIHMQFRILVLF